MINGLKLTFTGEELRTLLEERAGEYRQSSDRWQRQAERTHEDQTEEEPLLPSEMCENEADRHEWRAEVLEFLRDHLEALEVYQLGQSDLEFAELLPPKPGALEQEEYEERNRVGFQLERIGKRICMGPEIIQITNPDYRPQAPDTADCS